MITKFRTSTVFRNFIVMGIFIILILSIVLRGHYISQEIQAYGNTIDVAGFERTRTYVVMADAFIIREHYLAGDMENYETEKEKFFSEDSEYNKILFYLESIRDGNEELGLVPETDAGIIYDLNFLIDEINLYQGVIRNVVETPENSHNIHKVYQYSNYIVNDLDDLVEKFVTKYDEQNTKQNSLFMETFLLTLTFALILTIMNSRMFLFERIAKYDGLTGLRSIGYLKELSSKISNKEYSVIFIDLNKFKEINDTFGHSVGDDVLKNVGKRMNKMFKKDYAFRYGGDEFVVFLDKNSSKNIEIILNKIKMDIFKPVIDSSGYKHNIGGSIGVIGIDVKKDNIESALKIADKLMYKAKQLGIEEPIYAKNDMELKVILENQNEIDFLEED